MKFRRLIPVLALALLLLFSLAACSGNILPPKDGAQTDAPMPTPVPTPMPTPFSGTVDALEISQAFALDADGALSTVCPTRNFVSGRDTAIFVRLSGELGHAPNERDYLELYRGGELLGTWQPSEQSTADCLCYIIENGEDFTLDAGEYTARAVADDASASQGFTVSDTRSVNVLLLPVRGSFGGEISYPTEGWQDAFAVMQSGWPLANDGINVIKAPGLDLSAADYDLRTERGMWNVWEAVAEHVGMLGEYDLVIGLVSGAMGPDADCGSFGRDGIVLLDVSAENMRTTLSRFAAQTLLGTDGENAELWDALFGALTGEKEEFVPSARSTDRLRIAGLLGKDGSFTLRGTVCVPEDSVSATPLKDSGSYSLLITGADGARLYLICFEPNFRCPNDPTSDCDYAPFDLTIPVPAYAAKLQIFGPAQKPDGENDAQALLYTLDMTGPEQTAVFTDVPEGGNLHGIVRFAWENTTAASAAEAEDGEEKPTLPEPDYELYMCYDDVRLLVYRGKTASTELDMPSLPEPEKCTFLLLTSCSGKSACTKSAEIVSPQN